MSDQAEVTNSDDKKVSLDIRVTKQVEWIYPVSVTPEQAKQIQAGTMSADDLATLLDGQAGDRYWLDEEPTNWAIKENAPEVMK